MSRVGETGVGEMGIGETGVGEMGVGETGPNHSHVPFPIFKELTLLMSHRFYLNAMHASYMHRSAKPGSRCPLSVRCCPRSGRPRFLKKRNSNTDTYQMQLENISFTTF